MGVAYSRDSGVAPVELRGFPEENLADVVLEQE